MHVAGLHIIVDINRTTFLSRRNTFQVAKVQAAQNTKAAPGELTQMHDGEAPIKSAVDLGDPLAVRTLAELDPTTLTAPCCDVGTVLVYLRQTPDHPNYSTMVTCIEGLLLENGLVPFKDGSAVPVDILTRALSDRDEAALTEVLRDGTIDFRQFKTLRAVLSLPEGFERTDASFMFLVDNARERTNPNGGESGGLAFDGGAGGRGCAVM